MISNVKITGATTASKSRGFSTPLITSSQITNNLGAGILMLTAGLATDREQSDCGERKRQTRCAKPGVEVQGQARPVLKDNGIVDNAAEPIWIHGQAYPAADFEENFFGGLPAKKAIRLISDAEDGRSGEVSPHPYGPEALRPLSDHPQTGRRRHGPRVSRLRSGAEPAGRA